MRTWYPFLFGLLCVLLVRPPEASGQQADTTQLPEIAPQEIEIRGERQIALPSLERQPLVGFAAPPQVPRVPSDHRPYTEPYEQELDDLPESLPLPETVTEPLRPPSSPTHGFAEGGGGRYLGRFFEGRVLAPLSRDEHLSFHGTYTGMEDDPDSDVAEAGVRFVSRRDVVRVQADIHGSAERYALFGAVPAPRSDASPAPNREGYSVGSSFRLQSPGPVPVSAEAHFDRTVYTSYLQTNAGAGTTVHQNQAGLQGSVRIPVPLRPHLDAAYSRSWFDGTIPTETAYSLDAGGTGSFLRSDSAAVEVGVRGLVFDAPVRLAGPSSAHLDAAYVVPQVNAEWRAAEGVTLHLRNRPQLTEASLHRLYAENPYARHAPVLRPTVETTNAEVGLTLRRGPVRLITAAGYRYVPTYRSFVPNGQADYSGGLFRVRYDPARIFQGRGQVALQGIEGVQASLGFSVRDGSLGGTNRPLPNFASITADAMLTVSFAGGDGFLEAQSHFEGPRYASPAQTNRLDPYLLLDLEGSYALSEHLDLLARVENLAPQAPTKWAGYPRPPAQLSTGLRIRW